jgi:hypothetical protein
MNPRRTVVRCAFGAGLAIAIGGSTVFPEHGQPGIMPDHMHTDPPLDLSGPTARFSIGSNFGTATASQAIPRLLFGGDE